MLLAAVGCSSSSGGSAPTPTPPPTGYAALGDSYSAGQGLAAYVDATDTSKNSCHRSADSYPEIVGADRSLGTLTFVACSGAMTADLVSPDHQGNIDAATSTVLPAQISRIPTDAKAITLTIGGNDAGFASVLAQCITGHFGPITVFPSLFASSRSCADDASLKKTVAARLSALTGGAGAKTSADTAIVPVPTLLARIHSRAPRAQIYLLGYPALFGNLSKQCSVGGVSVLHLPLVGTAKVSAKLSVADAQWLNQVAGELDNVMRSAAGAAIGEKLPVTYVDVNPFFTSHRICDTSSSWIAGVSGSVNIATRSSHIDGGTFHPTEEGQRQGYAAALRAAGLS